jgi:FAD binding domain
MAAHHYDVIVVGARCAGSPTAMLLARLGYRVLLVDRATFPSDTISTHVIHPTGIAALNRWGLLGQLLSTSPLLCGYYAYWSGLPMAGRFENYIRPHRGWAACPTHDGLTVVVAGWPYAEFAANKTDIEGNYLKTFDGMERRRLLGLRQEPGRGGLVLRPGQPAHLRRRPRPGHARLLAERQAQAPGPGRGQPRQVTAVRRLRNGSSGHGNFHYLQWPPGRRSRHCPPFREKKKERCRVQPTSGYRRRERLTRQPPGAPLRAAPGPRPAGRPGARSGLAAARW